MKIKIEDIEVLFSSLHIKKINKKKDVEKLYYLNDSANVEFMDYYNTKEF